MINFNKIQRITIIAIVLALLFNPFVVAVLEQYFEMAYTGISVVSTMWVAGYLLVKVLTPQKVNVPKKSAKTAKAGKFIATA